MSPMSSTPSQTQDPPPHPSPSSPASRDVPDISRNQIVELCQTWALVLTGGGNQTTVFIQDIGITSAPRDGDGVNRVLAEPFSLLRPVTEANIDAIAKTLVRDGKAVWAESIGCVVLLVFAEDIGIATTEEELDYVDLGKEGGKKGPRRLHYYKEGNRPVLPREWTSGGKPEIPVSVKPGVVDGMMRMTAVRRKELDLKMRAHVWVVPQQQMKDKPSDISAKQYLEVLMTKVAKLLNDATASHAKSSFAQQLIECAKHRTGKVRQLPSLRIGVVKGNSGEGRKSANSDTYPHLHTTHALKAMERKDIPCETYGFAKVAHVDSQAFPLTTHQVDLVFLSGTVDMDSGSGDLIHHCISCWDETDAVANDWASTWAVEFLSKRENGKEGDNGKEVVYEISTVPGTLKPFKSRVRESVSKCLGAYPKRHVVRTPKGTVATKALAWKAVGEGENQIIASELTGFASCCAVSRLDEDVKVKEEKKRTIGGWKKADKPGPECIKETHSIHMCIPLEPAVRLHELLNQAATLGTRAACAAWRVCTSLLGLNSIQCVALFGNCPEKLPSIDDSEGMRKWIERNVWHVHPREEAFVKWLTSSKLGHCVRLLSEGEKSRSTEILLNLDVMRVVVRALPHIQVILRDLMYTSKYDRDLWASDLGSGMRIESGRLGGDRFDHAIFMALFRACEEIGTTTWSDLRMPARIDRVLVAISEQKGSTKLHDVLWKPIIAPIEHKCAGKYITYFLDKTKTPVLSNGIVKELPEIRVVIQTEAESVEDSGTKKGGKKRKKSGKQAWRQEKKPKIESSTLGLLQEAIGSKKKVDEDDDVKGALRSIVTGLAVRLLGKGLKETKSVEEVEEVVEKSLEEAIDVDLGEPGSITEDGEKLKEAMVGTYTFPEEVVEVEVIEEEYEEEEEEEGNGKGGAGEEGEVVTESQEEN